MSTVIMGWPRFIYLRPDECLDRDKPAKRMIFGDGIKYTYRMFVRTTFSTTLYKYEYDTATTPQPTTK